MTKQQAEELLKRFYLDRCSDEEQQIVESWIEQELDIGSWHINQEEKILFGKNLKIRIDEAKKFSAKPLLFAVDQNIKPDTKPDIKSIGSSLRKLWISTGVAASLAVAVGTTLYFHKTKIKHNNAVTITQDIPPGRNSATLTLANGKKIVLSDKSDGELANEAGVCISKAADGQIIYTIKSAEPSEKAGSHAVKYNVLSTTLGEQYQVHLPDGTKVWLNCASSLRYPTSFKTLKERRVELNGEAYFEVKKEPEHPFIVKTHRQEVAVLGTHFNINAYTNEPTIKTTLLEGSVRVMASGNEEVLKPGQQAALTGNMIDVAYADTEVAVAWKNNQFMFESEKIESIMRMVERWYNVKVEFEGEIPTDRFGGVVSKLDHVSKVLSILELTGKVHFKVEGRRIIVTK